MTKPEIAERNKYGELFTLALSIYVLIELGLEVSIPIPENILRILQIIDLFICGIFLFEFFYYFSKSANKLKYWKLYFIDFISALPFYSIFRVGRLTRLFRILRVLRMFKPLRMIIEKLYKNNNVNIFYTMLIITLLMIFFFGYGLFVIEYGINKNINNIFDGIWWGFTSVSTVGYGDISPVTTAGRIFSIFLILAGVALFSSFTALLSSKFVNNSGMENEIAYIKTELKEIKELLNKTSR